MSFEGHSGIGFRHTFPVVDDLHTSFSTSHNEYLDVCSVGIDGILNHLLNDRRRPLHHFAGGDLVGHRIG